MHRYSLQRAYFLVSAPPSYIYVCRRAAAAAHKRKTTVRTVPRAPRTATTAKFAPATIVLGARPHKIEKGALYTKSSSHNQDGAEIPTFNLFKRWKLKLVGLVDRKG